ncbi:MAG TPA: kelch repeat-containing protein [Bacteroidales bacterium]|nr:kelch repeat-containing protein [Bacteroidales bacterium]
MKKAVLFFTLLCLVLFQSCQKEAEIREKDYPYLITTEVSDITNTSVVFNGKIISTGNEEIIEYGFLWDTSEPEIETANKIALNNPANIGSYSAKISSNLIKDTEQLVRAYLKTNNLLVYGNTIKFTSNGGLPAEITEIIPLKGYSSSKAVIKGNNFGNDKNEVAIYFGDKTVPVDSCSNNRIVFRVPDIDTDIEEYITISIYNKQVKSNHKFRAFTYWKKTYNMSGNSRFGATAFSLNNVGYVCFGKQPYGDEFNDLFALNPETNSWSRKADFPGNPRAFSVACVIENIAYLGFGSGGDTYYHDLWSYETETDKWTKVLEDDRIKTHSDAYFVLNNELYIFSQGGSYKYSPASNEFTEIDRFPGDYRFFTSGVNCDGLGYLIAGQRPGNKLLKDLWCYDPTSNTWTKKADLPGSNRDGIACFAISNKIYAGLGGIWGGEHLDFYEYSPSIDTWVRVQNFPGDKRELPVSFTICNKGYLGTGRKNITDVLNDFWEFNPDKE